MDFGLTPDQQAFRQSIEQFARESAKKGYPLSDGPHPHGKGGAIAFIDAPEGYEIELIQRGSDI